VRYSRLLQKEKADHKDRLWLMGLNFIETINIQNKNLNGITLDAIQAILYGRL